MRPTGRRGRGAAQPHSRVPSWESLGSWFPREPWVKPRGSKPRLPRARGCQARVWGLPAGVARRGNQTRAVATQQNPLVQPSTHSVTHPSVPQTLAEGLWVPASAVVLRKVAEQAVQGASAAPDPRATSAAVTREAGVPSAVGEAARPVPSLRGAGREAGVGFALGRRRGGPSRRVCSARDSGGVSPTLPRRRASWRAGGCSVWSLRPRPGGGGAGRVEWPRQRPACAVWLQAADGRNGASGAGEGGSMPGGGRAPRPEPHPPGGAVSPRGVGVRVLRSRKRRDGRAESP